MVYTPNQVKVSRRGSLYELVTRTGRTNQNYVLSGYFKTRKEANKRKYELYSKNASTRKNPYSSYL